MRDSLLVLSYHRVLPRNYSELSIVEPGMFVFCDTLEMHLAEVLKHFEPVDLADWLCRREQGRRLPERACAITFDDGWHDNYKYAFPILQRLQVPATIFVVSALVGTDYSFWPERLARRLQTLSASELNSNPWLDRLISDSRIELTSLGPESISRTIGVAKRESDLANHAHLDELDELFGAVAPGKGRDLASWTELNEMVDSGYVSIGSHTRHHVRMRESLDRDTLLEEIVSSREEIVGNCRLPAELFCFPNGDMTETAIDLVKKTYRGACTTDTGWNSATTPAHAIQRVAMHEDRCDTRNAFVSRLVSSL